MKKRSTCLLFLLLICSGNLFAQIPTKGLIGYWPLNGNAADESNGGNNGTIQGAALCPDRFNKEDSAFSFDGVNDKIYMNSTLSGKTMSVSLWIQFNRDPYSLDTVVNARSYVFWYDFPALFFTTIKAGSVGDHQFFFDWWQWKGVATKNITWDSNTWYHIVGTYDGVTGKIYVNGTLNNDSNYTASITGNTLYLGYRNYSTQYPFNGKIDEVLLYNRALSEQEVKNLYTTALCFKTVTFTVQDTLIINANLSGLFPLSYANTIKVYPNPGKDHLIISSDQNSMGFSIKVINAMSQVVYQATINQVQTSVDLNTWSGKGTYFIQFYDPDGKLLEVRKIILQ